MDKVKIALETSAGEIIFVPGRTMLTIQKEYDLNQDHQECTGFCAFCAEWLKKEKGLCLRIEKIRWDISQNLRVYHAMVNEWNARKKEKELYKKRGIDETNRRNKMRMYSAS